MQRSEPTNTGRFYISLTSAQFGDFYQLREVTDVLENSASRRMVLLGRALRGSSSWQRFDLIQYRENVGLAPDVDLDEVAYHMLNHGVRRLDDRWARRLLNVAAPRGLNTIEAWDAYAYAAQNSETVDHASGRSSANESAVTDASLRALSDARQLSITSNISTSTAVQPSSTALQSTASSSNHQSSPNSQYSIEIVSIYIYLTFTQTTTIWAKQPRSPPRTRSRRLPTQATLLLLLLALKFPESKGSNNSSNRRRRPQLYLHHHQHHQASQRRRPQRRARQTSQRREQNPRANATEDTG